MIEPPETQYAKTPDGLHIAYQTLGEGPTDIVLLSVLSCIEIAWEEPTFAHALTRLAHIGRLILIDVRGLGASDPVPLGSLPTPEAWMEDISVVMDAVGSSRIALVTEGGPAFIAVVFAATYPERTSALVLINAWPRLFHDDDIPFAGFTEEGFDDVMSLLEQDWGHGALVPIFAPSRMGDKAFRRWAGRYERFAASPSAFSAIVRWSTGLDMRPLLSSVQVPTLVLQREGTLGLPPENARYLAQHITGAKLTLLPGQDRFFYSEDADRLIDEVEEFITGVPPVREPDRALATVLFTDFVASTEHAARLGDKNWTAVLDQHDALVRRELDRHRGRKVQTTGDGVLATFDGPARAVRCAQAICEGMRAQGIEVRAGLHAGEVELRGDDIGGIAVHIGARVSALAGPGEVLVTSTVKDLVVGSGIVFADRGTHALKGVPDEWRLFAVES